MFFSDTALLADPTTATLLKLPRLQGFTVSEKLSKPGGDTPLVVSIQKVNSPLTVGLPLIVAVPLWLSTNVTPGGSDPAGEKRRAGTGNPVVVTVKEFAIPLMNVA
jgi:hypothetical protein